MSARTRSIVVGVVGIAVAAGLGLGCGGAQQRDTLMETVQTYNDGVRWQRFTAAAVAVPPAEREQFLDEREDLAVDLRITDYEVVRVADHGDQADIQVKLTWFRDSQGTVHDTWVRQRWERQGGAWRVIEEQRVRGEPMPGVAEDTDLAAGEVDAGAGAVPAGATP